MKLTRQAMKTRRCPRCRERGQLREMTYGYLAQQVDEAIYISVGCTIDGESNNIKCIGCGWEGLKNEFPTAKEVAEGVWQGNPNC